MPDRVPSSPKQPLAGLVINFNAPELNHLAIGLARGGHLRRYLRPYVNKGRSWERALSAIPLAGRAYLSSFGRRRIESPALLAVTEEAGVLPDFAAAAILRSPFLSAALRSRWNQALYESIRASVSREGSRDLADIDCIVAYQGFALPAFRQIRRLGSACTFLNYPIAHHREQFAVRAEEAEREPAFASTWPGFDHWPEGYEAQLDDEIALADGILVGSSYARASFVAHGVDAQKLHVASYGVDHGIFHTAPRLSRRASFKAIYAGVLTQRKGISYLLRGWQKFERPGTELTLVGNLVSGTDPFVPFREAFQHLPHLTRAALAEQYRESDVFVFPTLLEGMGLVVLEAMACGLPVIVTANGPGDLVRDGVDGYVIPVRDPEAIADRLEQLYRDPDLRRTMGENARQRALEFSWERYSDDVIAYIGARMEASSRVAVRR
jgi:glycosyltransferase involved in cell wall biosynthesis